MSREIKAIKFKQWLSEWDHFNYDPEQHRRKPNGDIYMFSMSAIQLRALSGVFRRERDNFHGEGLQRKHDPKRSKIIRDFVRYGYPYSSLSDTLRVDDYEHLKKPGWLPTAIVINILGKDDSRRGKKVDPADLVEIESLDENLASIKIPYQDSASQWKPKELEPFEVIDGQHRLWAFDEEIIEDKLPGEFELPVVAFSGLDIGWQAYLFWSINVSPKRINPSHAFDLFPLLRSAEWLETFSELKIYREARAQELTEFLYTHPQSPWHGRINMLGQSTKDLPAGTRVTQAGWVRAILSSYLSAGASKGNVTQGLFSSNISPTNGPLNWSRSQQVAFLIFLWNCIEEKVSTTDAKWAESLRDQDKNKVLIDTKKSPPEFYGNHTMLNQEQGVRGILSVSNELFFDKARLSPEIFEWEKTSHQGQATTEEDIDAELETFKKMRLANAVKEFAISIAGFDWRSAEAKNLTDDERLLKRAFRGSGGYVALREQLQKHIQSFNAKQINNKE